MFTGSLLPNIQEYSISLVMHKAQQKVTIFIKLTRGGLVGANLFPALTNLAGVRLNI